MNDFWTAALIAGSWVLLAIGVAYGKDAAACAWTALKQRKASQGYATLTAWPSTLAPCESWLGAEISAPVIAEAEGIAERAWLIWEASPVIEEGSDD